MIKEFRSAQLAKALYQKCHRLPLKGNIRDQLERASLSIYLNLVEGSAKPSKKEQARFFNIALASLREVEAILDLIEAKEEAEIANKTGANIFCLIRSLNAR